METEEESGKHETDILVTGSESDCNVRGRNERRNDGCEKENDDDNMRNAERENTSDTTDDDRSRQAADHSESEKEDSQGRGTGPVSCVTGGIVGIGRRHNDS